MKRDVSTLDRLFFWLFLLGLTGFLLILIVGLIAARNMTALGSLVSLSLFPTILMAAFSRGAWRWWSRKRNSVDVERDSP